jgi:hypothetical protein
MYTVLILDRFEFAHLFIENGVNLKDFLTLRCLLMLYNEVCMMILICVWKRFGQNGIFHTVYLNFKAP